MARFSDVEISHLESVNQLKCSNITIATSGPLHASVHAEVKYGKSMIGVTVNIWWSHLLEIPRCSTRQVGLTFEHALSFDGSDGSCNSNEF